MLRYFPNRFSRAWKEWDCIDWPWWIDVDSSLFTYIAKDGFKEGLRIEARECYRSFDEWVALHKGFVQEAIYIGEGPSTDNLNEKISLLGKSLQSSGLLILKKYSFLSGGKSPTVVAWTKFVQKLRHESPFRVKMRIYAIPRSGSWLTSTDLSLLLMHIFELRKGSPNASYLSNFYIFLARSKSFCFLWPWQYIIMEKIK